MKRDDDAWRAAVHEAGHAAVAILLGRELKRVRLRPAPETTVAPRPLPKLRPKTPAERAALEAELMLNLAGIASERVCGVARDAVGALDDLGKAAELAVRIAGRARAEPMVQHFLSVVERMLSARRARLERLARALLESGSMSAAEARTFIPRG